jgi:PKD repeat protein
MYIVVRPVTGSAFIVKTIDDWVTNSTITMPGINNLAIISLDPENDQIIWLAYPHGNNGNKVYKSINGGSTWVNQTSSQLDAQNIQSMTTIGGTSGGVYLATSVSVYYKNNTMASWAIDNINLPTTIAATGIRPFYRDGKIRLASYGKGIWESPLYETPSRPVAKIMVDKLTAELNCNVFYFDDYSMLNHTNATWSWTFQNANISTSTIRNPQVTFNTLGNHMVTLTVKDANQITSKDTLFVSTVNLNSSSINQNFELQLVPQGWFLESNSTDFWKYNDTVGGFGQSTKCMSFNNYAISQPGSFSDIIAPINLVNAVPMNTKLTFDVAYAFFAANYADTLQVLVSTDCGANYTTVYAKGGTILSTAPPQNQIQFLPLANEWRKDTIDLSSYIGNANVFIKFRNINQYGQALYIDNINMLGAVLNTNEVVLDKSFVYPNPSSRNGAVVVKGNDNSDIEFRLFSIDGKLIDKIFTKFNTSIPLGKYNLSQGTYLYNIYSKDKILNGKLVITDRN